MTPTQQGGTFGVKLMCVSKSFTDRVYESDKLIIISDDDEGRSTQIKHFMTSGTAVVVRGNIHIKAK